jgi:hypothetical protein
MVPWYHKYSIRVLYVTRYTVLVPLVPGTMHGRLASRVSIAMHMIATSTGPPYYLARVRRWKRVTKRHDSIRDSLATVLGRVHGTSATVEPRVLNPKGGADQRRGTIKVSKHGNTWILDVGVVCPGTQRYVDQGSGTSPGLAAEAYAAVKVAKYADQDNFIPFILDASTERPVTGLPL